MLGRRALPDPLYSALSLVLIGWLVSAAIRAPQPAALASRKLARGDLSLSSCRSRLWLLIAGLAEASPLSVLPYAPTDAAAEPGHVASITRHPVLWGFLLWAVAHIPPTGHVRSADFFSGGMSLLAVSGMFALDRRAREKLGAERQWATNGRKRAPLIPFAG